ncbi:multidrug effflux MFS transporter [Pseudomonas sp. dw_358]|uniref:multidrug effflux MFS transporter n=1 Tax=Pseudomonas sp. dw_358 TaxID=2720083 RepID=UPI001BD4E014|nr:multidrug effflux MFS transporter [Pseudomonas sp. dw_358]
MKASSVSPSFLKLVIICGVLTAFPSMSIDLGLPGFAEVAESMGVSMEQVAQTLSFFFLGFSISPLICGPLSDRIGRRPVLLSACAVYAVASLLATCATAFNMLLLWRLLQGTGAGIAAVLAITVIRDYHEGSDARRLLSYAAVVRIIGPTTAPSIGNLLLLLGSWRWIYGFMTVGGVLMLWMVAFALPESSRTRLEAATAGLSEPRAPRRSVLKDYAAFLSDRLSLSYTLVMALTFASHFSYVTGSLYVFINVLHISTVAYGAVFAITALCLMLGSFLSGQLARHDLSGKAIVAVALAVSLVSSLATLTLAATHHLDEITLTALLCVNTLCLGLLTPCAQQGAMERAGAFAGTASALMNAMTTGMGAIASYVEGALLEKFQAPAVVMSGQMAFCLALAMVIFVTVVRRKGAVTDPVAAPLPEMDRAH